MDEFRSVSLQLVQSHYRSSSEQGFVNRIEVLPISWHATLHSGIDKKLQMITLESIPKLRHFTNDTLLDILFYTSPIYCETIMQTVGSEMNRLYDLFRSRNPEFEGSVYLGGHSLGSLIMFDLLCHQKPTDDDEDSSESAEVNGQAHDDAHKNTDNNVKIYSFFFLKIFIIKFTHFALSRADGRDEQQRSRACCTRRSGQKVQAQ